MATLDLNALFNLGHTEFSDVFQTEAGTTIGHVRKNITVTGTAGTTLQIGHILQDNGDGTATIPATTASITNPVIYCGDDLCGSSFQYVCLEPYTLHLYQYLDHRSLP